MSAAKLYFQNVLLAEGLSKDNDEHRFLIDNFCGTVVDDMDKLCELIQNSLTEKIVYLTGDRHGSVAILLDCKIFIVKEHSSNYNALVAQEGGPTLVTKGEIPINVHNVGVYFRKFFVDRPDYYACIHKEHVFQSLTESNKSGEAFRKGIYLTPIKQHTDNSLHFHLLRCSSNLQGPTDNFRTIDYEIVDKTNNIGAKWFENAATFNHVLAQTYYNQKNEDGERKATIKAHSDKTKDMPIGGLIAFATFYDMNSIKDNARISQKDYDYLYQGKTSILTQLEFVLKDAAAYPNLTPKFRVTLYPNSVFIISLETNRLYTHEIKPSPLPIDKIPVRLGYVMRSSMRKAVYRNNQTLIIDQDGTEHLLEPMNDRDMTDIKDLYRCENSSSSTVQYRPIYTSLNQGDYQKPIL